MATSDSIMAELKKKGTEKNRKTYARHNMDPARVFGVSVADLKVIAKTIKRQQDVACALLDTGNMDAMYLAGMVADGGKVTRATRKMGRKRRRPADDLRVHHPMARC